MKYLEDRKKGTYFENKHNSPYPKKRLGYAHRRRQGEISLKFLAFLIILCFERRCRKQNTVARLKSKDLPGQFCGLATPLGTRRAVVPKLWYAKAFKVVREILLFFYTKRRHFVFSYRVLLISSCIFVYLLTSVSFET